MHSLYSFYGKKKVRSKLKVAFHHHLSRNMPLDLFQFRTCFLGIGLTEDLYLHRTTQTQKNADIHPCLEWDSNS
jgi:hypothetical protein